MSPLTELRAVDAAINAVHANRRPTWREHLEWLDAMIDSALRHARREVAS